MRIILADHFQIARSTLMERLKEEPGFDLIGESVTGQDLLTLAENQAFDLVLVEKDLPGIPIEELLTRLSGINPRPIVIVMSTKVEHSRRMLNAGADAFISKGDDPDWLIKKLSQYARQIHQN